MNIMIDVDGVMNTLLETACEITGIDYERVRQYSLADLDPAERSLVRQQSRSGGCSRSWGNTYNQGREPYEEAM